MLNGKEYLLDIEQAKKLNLLKEKDSRVKSWEEFKEKYPNQFFQCLTPQEEEALAAFSKLLKLRRDWIGGWEPNWENNEIANVIINWGNQLRIDYCTVLSKPLSFPTREMAQEFLNTFYDLIEEAKILI